MHRPTFLAACAALAVLASAARAQVFVNEIHYDNASTDTGEFIEVAGPAGTDLTGWTIVLYNGANGLTYDTDALAGVLADQCNGIGTAVIAYPVDGLQNGAPDGLALVDASSTVLQFLSYEGTFTAINGPAIGMLSTSIGVSESSLTPVGHSLQRFASGAWGAGPHTSGLCNCIPSVATATSFGTGNAHAVHGIGVLSTAARPVVGTTAELTFTYASPDGDNSAVLFGLGRLNPPYAFGPVDIHIDPGLPTVAWPFVNAMGGSFQVPIALAPELCTGLSIYAQCFVLDMLNPGTPNNLLGTNAVEWVIGEQ